ncbi:DUF493 domain-containing protein [Marinoscillum sp. MHG1-6]|uniref:DUF493 domain-containing protein n=1 Tax=Marinoscillum sp. MHG1-6 TaxID=2959627 RepID=UPI0021589434|nr:DUF493 domain-containing protein [Marinoscillum sp. MHG1-6]
MSWDIQAFKEKLESQHQFPGSYSFKFIVPVDKKEQVLALLPKSDISFKESAKGTYVSITSVAKLQTSQEVLDVYIAANNIEGLIAL